MSTRARVPLGVSHPGWKLSTVVRGVPKKSVASPAGTSALEPASIVGLAAVS
jgi:hypothetical protein